MSLCFGALLFPLEARAAQATITVTGTVLSGTDGNPDSKPPGAANVFGGGINLAGEAFTLTLQVSDSEGAYTSATCADGSIYYSSLVASSTSSPPTATLQIGNGSFIYGAGGYPFDGIYLTVRRTAHESCYSLNSFIFAFSELTGGASGFGYAALYTLGNLYTGDLFVSVPLQSVAGSATFPFTITVYSDPTHETLLKYAHGVLTPQFISVEGEQPTVVNAKSLGDPGDCSCPLKPGLVSAGEPITVGTGNMFETAMDYTTAGPNPLAFTRSYNSLQNTSNPGTFATMLGPNWRSSYDRYIQMTSATSVAVERGDGQVLAFTSSGGSWTGDSDVDVKLTQSGGTWTLTDIDNTVETYTAITKNVGTLAVSYGRLASIQSRNGYTQTLAYNANNALLSVTDSYNRTLTFTYNSFGKLHTVATPDGTVLTYGYAAGLLASVTYATTPVTSQTYLYEDDAAPTALTGILDENGNRFASWTYDSKERALTSQHAGGADLTTIAYDDTTGNRTVTSPLGQTALYTFATLQSVPKVTAINRQATTTTAAATETFTYDANGYTASRTDWNGTRTTYVNNSYGQPTTITEAVGSSAARTTAITYHATFHDLPLNVVTPGLTTTFTYDAAGELLTKTLTDTTSTTVPYSTNGTARVWTNAWANFLLASTTGPRTDVVQKTGFTYDASGALIAVTNALGQVTKITAHSGGGLPETIVDPNGVTTTLTYSPRQWLLTSTLATTAGALTTTLSYDAAGNLIKTTLPDGSALTNAYDAAHRLIAVADLFNQSTAYTLDANGDRTQTATATAAAAIAWKHSGSFDALGRMLKDIGGVGQTTATTFDAAGNPLTVTDPLGRVTTQAFDPLNRIISAIDAASGVTRVTYDPHDRPLTVIDPNDGSTAFVYDGFGDVIERISPDTGKTIYHYDLAGNLTQSLEATGAVQNRTYDALNRPLSVTFPADTSETVTYAYDQAGHGFGVGRLTGVTDAVGTLSRTYDERGNNLSETRKHAAATMLTTTTYDAASRVASIIYPSGWTVAYTRDVMGRITAINANPPAVASKPVLAAIAYQPFGPVNALTYGNGIAETRGFDLDYRLLALRSNGRGAVQNLTYAYDADNNVLNIADGVTAANTQALGYDVLDHLTGATGAYGSLGYSYSPIGNRLTQTSAGVLSTYTDAPHSNQLAAIKTGTATQTLGTTASGNVSSFAPALGTVTGLTYNQANRLATASAGTSLLAQYTYDGFGQRLVKLGSITGTTLYQYDLAGHLLEENDGAGHARVDYVYLGDRPIATIQPSNGKVYFLHDDRLGTPQLATDASQAVQWSANYQPFGFTSTGVGLIVQNLRLPGQEFDTDTGLYHNGFRDYAPGLGRYLESDPIGLNGGLNTYGYVGGNPATNIDLHGLQFVAPIPGPFGMPIIPPQYIPGTPQNQQWNQWTNQTGNRIDQWLRNWRDSIGVCGSSYTPADPGNCEPSRQQYLQSQVDNACKPQPPLCRPGDTCSSMEQRIAAFSSCADARGEINQECYGEDEGHQGGSGDQGHQIEYTKARQSAATCQGLLATCTP